MVYVYWYNCCFWPNELGICLYNNCKEQKLAMDILKKLVWVGILLIAFGAIAYAGLITRNSVNARNLSSFWEQQLINASGDLTYVVLGDATALGLGASTPQNSYAFILSERLRSLEHLSIKTVNLASIDADIQDVINKQIPKIAQYDPDYITVTVGMKDVDRGDSIDLITQNLGELMEKLPGSISYFGQLQAVKDNKKDKIIQEINGKISLIANDMGINIVPLYSATEKGIKSASYYDWDFVHPNDKGHELWAEAFITAIE